MPGRDTEDTEDLLRTLAPQVLGAVVRRYGHFSVAEDAVQEALLAAAVQWPDAGVPGNPQGWLITVAARRLTDLLRAEQTRQRREETAARRMLPGEWLARPADHSAPDSDDTLILLFLCCHPALSAASQIALTLRAVGGLTTAEIARAFLVTERTMTRRITRAKQAIAGSGIRPAATGPRAGQRPACMCRISSSRGLRRHVRPGPAPQRASGRRLAALHARLPSADASWLGLLALIARPRRTHARCARPGRRAQW